MVRKDLGYPSRKETTKVHTLDLQQLLYVVDVQSWCLDYLWLPRFLSPVTKLWLPLHYMWDIHSFIWFDSQSYSTGRPSVLTVYCIGISRDVSGAVNVTVNWTLSGRDSADFYLINITTNAPHIPYGGLVNTTTASVTHSELTGFVTGYEYNITVRGINCGSQEGRESEPLTIRTQGVYSYWHGMINMCNSL